MTDLFWECLRSNFNSLEQYRAASTVDKCACVSGLLNKFPSMTAADLFDKFIAWADVQVNEKDFFNNKKKYRVMIEETVWEVFEVEADSKEEAKEKISKGYRDCTYVLEPGNLGHAQMHIVDEHNTTVADDDWEEV